MIEILPIRVLTDEDVTIFGSLNVALGKLERGGFPVAKGIVVTAPHIRLRTVLKDFDFGTKEMFEQSLILVKKEISSIPPPEELIQEVGRHKKFLLGHKIYKSVENLWLALLQVWLDQIKERLWNRGFYPGICDDLDPQIVVFAKEIESFGDAYFDPGMPDDVEICVKSGKLHPRDLKKVADIVLKANKKLFIPQKYEWILDGSVKLTNIKPYTEVISQDLSSKDTPYKDRSCEARCAVKVFYDSSDFIQAEKIFDLDKPKDSFEVLVSKLSETALAFSDSPVFLKLADMSEGMGKLRGTLRLLHQQSLFDPMIEALDLVRHKKGLVNIHIVVPFVRGVSELIQIKRELAAKNLTRKKSLQIWMEVCTPENIINLEKYLEVGIDGVVLNINELITFFNGFDPAEENLALYKGEVDGLLKFLEDALKLFHNAKIPFIACGSLTFEAKVLEFLVEKGIYGVVAEKYQAPGIKDLLYQVEKRVILKRSS